MTAILTLHNPDATFRYYQDGHWRPESFYMLLRQNAQNRPDARVLRDARRHLSYAEALAWVDAIAARFEAAGLTPGDRVALSMTNRPSPSSPVRATATSATRHCIRTSPRPKR